MRAPRVTWLTFLLGILCLSGCGQKKSLATETIGPYTFERYEFTDSALSAGFKATGTRSTEQRIAIRYGRFGRKIRPTYHGRKMDYASLVLRLPSKEPAWLVCYLSDCGLLRESAGTEIQPLLGSGSGGETGKMVRLDEHRWHVPELDYDAYHGQRAGHVLDAATLELRRLDLSIPSAFMSELFASIVALTPDGRGAAWVAHDWDERTRESQLYVGAVTPPATVRRLALPADWLNAHPYPKAEWPNYDRLPDVPTMQPWFDRYFRWEQDAEGAWAVRWQPGAERDTTPSSAR